MAVPPKRKSSRTERRASQRGAGPQPEPGESSWVVAPPRTGCPAWHFYWCDGHEDWHHHEADAVEAIAASFPTQPEA